MDFMVLIVPDCIPIPGTSVEILQGAAADMRTAGEEICEGGEGIEATWQGLQPHYTAPESEDLFAAMGPVATKGGTIQDDFTAVADALDTFADEADTAKTKLRSLKEDARAFVEEVGDDEKWNADLENFHRNRQLILEVNRVWGAFQEAERACANAIAAVTGSGNTYVAAGEEPPDTGEIAYGIDPADIPDSVYDLTTFEGWKQGLGDSWEHLTHADFPWPVDWARDAYMVQWDYFGPGMLWDTGVGAVAGIGLWREGSGWASSVGEAADNFVAHKTETLQGYGALAGFYGEEGWMNPFDADERSWDTWKANAGPVWTEVAHDLVPWREWDERPAYTVTAAAGNVALTVVGLPVRGGMLAAKIGNLASGGIDTGGADLGALEMRGLDGGGQRPVTFWGNGTAADPGFDLSGYISRAQSGFGGTMSEINGRLGEIDTGALANISEWSANRGLTGAGTDSRGPAPEPAGESSVFNPTPGRQDASAGSGGREDEPAWRETSSVTGERSEQNAEPQDSGNDMDRGLAELLDSENGSSAPLDALPPRDVAASEVNAPGRPIELSEEAMERTTQELLEEVEAFKADAPELWEQLHRHQEALVGSDGMEINASDSNRVDARSNLDITNSVGDDNTSAEVRSTTQRTNIPADRVSGSDNPILGRRHLTLSEAAQTELIDAGRTGQDTPPFSGLDPETMEPTTLEDGKKPGEVQFGHTDASRRWFDDTGLAHIEGPDQAEHARIYNRIRSTEGDTQKIADYTGIRLEVIDRIKNHIFLRDHEITVSPGDTRIGRFTPMPHIAKWWLEAQEGKIPENEKGAFLRWLTHESVESKLMEWGMPYRSSNSAAFEWDEIWEEEVPKPTPDHYGAHDLSPSENQQDPYGHYLPEWRAPDISPNADLSNSEEIAQIIFERFNK
ncbi:hypothetical protein [Nocardiopsis algeriensis]|uniref:WXG100 family type VII secretion target n=1 Tax=Nocardiopsis algeriensis TaxID=1478215 RepID=A0A841IN72_9ACTN|nr:hypothetical protein [Nocardiopsis algeriensis]MBB6120269.1 hypothetical protein [Nocardiopsis algeriensis]